MNNSTADVEAGAGQENNTKTPTSPALPTVLISWRAVRNSLVFIGVVSAILVLYHSAINPFEFLPTSFLYHGSGSSSPPRDLLLEKVLKNASMEDGTVILTTLNDAWAEPDSLLDLFMKSFKIGNGTQRLLNHLVIVTLDQKAYSRCIALHPHCYELDTRGVNFSSEAFFMTPDYLQMMWRRIDFLSSVLQLGYGFVFTDTDIMWLQDPFKHFYPDADFQIACDIFLGNSEDLNNYPNGGFTYVRSNPKTIKFYKFWYESRLVFPGLHDQDVLNKIKTGPIVPKIGLKIRFLDTVYFGGFCQVSRDFNLVSTMHANCCVGLDNKIHDLRIVLDDWNNFFTLTPERKASSMPSWSVPQNCSTSFERGNPHKDDQKTGN